MRKTVTCLLICLFVNVGFVEAQVFNDVSFLKKYPVKKLRYDVDFLLKKFQQIHPNYFKETPKDTVYTRYANLKASIQKPLTRLDFMNMLSFTAFGVIKDGHNFVNIPNEDLQAYERNNGKVFPIPVKISNGHLLARAGRAIIPYNAEIISINGHETSDVLKQVLKNYNPENQAYKESFLSGDFGALYWLNYGTSDVFKIVYRDNSGQLATSNLKAAKQQDVWSIGRKPNAKRKKYLF